MKRYFFHGDKSDSEIDSYYCRGCDAFVGAEHFQKTSHDLTHEQLLNSSYEYFKLYSKTEWHRPKSVINLLETPVGKSR